MKSFDSRLRNNLFPKKPAAFDRMVKKQLENVCGQSEAPQGTIVRFPGSESDQKQVQKRSNMFGRIGIVAAAAVLVVCTVVVGAVAVLAGKEKTAPVAPASEQPTAATSKQPTATAKTVRVDSMKDFLAAIAPHTNIILSAGTYDLNAAADAYTGDNPYVSFVQSEYWADSSERFLKITGVDDLLILTDEDVECRLAAKGCETVLLAESCSELWITGITFCGDEYGVEFKDCSTVFMDRCAFETSTPVFAQQCEGVVLTKLNLSGFGSAAFFDQCKDVRVQEIDISDCGMAFTMDDCTEVQIIGCIIHDCGNDGDASDAPSDGEEGDASCLIQLFGNSDSVLSVTVLDCDLYNNKCTFLLSADGVDCVTLTGLRIHDNNVERMFSFDETSEPAGSHVIANCGIDRNKIGEFLFCGLSETRVSLSGTSIADNDIETVFFGGDVTVSDCAFASLQVAHWIGSHESYPDLRTFVHDADGNELGENELTAMR